MYHLTVRDHFMIAHSFQGAIFGPAQRTHGATYVVDVTFQRRELDDDDLVVDIGQASATLKRVLGEFHCHNLDELEAFQGRNTTTEFLARVIFERLLEAIRQGRLGRGADELAAMRVTLHESHVAWASYEDEL
jgi:6-pyruvoyltetrahydropterin/6-carboxytetrahydropterin synthase